MSTYNWAELTREEVSELAPRVVTVLPVASTEQHGPHLATVTDTALVGAVLARACAMIGDDVDILVAPTQPYGSSDHHLPFGGTLSLTSATFRAVLGDLLRSLARSGAKRTLLLNGHGGNASLCNIAASDTARETEMTVVTTSYWELIQPPESIAGFPGHAGMFETSMMLAVHPELVHPERARQSPGSVPERVKGLQIIPPDLWQRINGFTDDPREARSGVGSEVLEHCAEALASVLRRVASL